MKGSYTLLFSLEQIRRVKVGSLGAISFDKGFYAYNGSAFGPGGLKRVERHREKSRDGGDAHWHIDYILRLPESEIVKVFRTGEDIECSLSREMEDRFEGFDSFGCSDCGCDSHLFLSSREHLEVFLDDFYSD